MCIWSGKNISKARVRKNHSVRLSTRRSNYWAADVRFAFPPSVTGRHMNPASSTWWSCTSDFHLAGDLGSTTTPWSTPPFFSFRPLFQKHRETMRRDIGVQPNGQSNGTTNGAAADVHTDTVNGIINHSAGDTAIGEVDVLIIPCSRRRLWSTSSGNATSMSKYLRLAVT